MYGSDQVLFNPWGDIVSEGKNRKGREKSRGGGFGMLNGGPQKKISPVHNELVFNG